MKTHLLFCLLLLSGLSFAQPGSYNWMEYAQGRYACSTFYYGYGYGDSPYAFGLYEIVDNAFDGCGRWWDDCESMSSNFGYMYENAASNMYCNSGCDCDPSVSYFRQNMLSQAAYSTSFRVSFLAGLREFIADPEVSPSAKAEFRQDLAYAREDYLSCLNSVGACYSMPR